MPPIMQPKKRLPILQRVSNLLKTSILVTKMRKPVIAKLVHLKKARKLKRFKLLRHYNYRFLEEYEFSSASSTPLIHYNRKQYVKNNTILRDLSSMFSLCRCFGNLKSEGGQVLDYSLAMETALPAITMRESVVMEPVDLEYDEEEEEDSVDQRAERFIQWFYQEMRMQKLDSV